MPALSKKKKKALLIGGCLDELVRRGLLNGPKILTARGLGQWHQIKASGLRPTDEEIRTVLRLIQMPDATAENVAILVGGLLDGKI